MKRTVPLASFLIELPAELRTEISQLYQQRDLEEIEKRLTNAGYNVQCGNGEDFGMEGDGVFILETIEG